MDGSRPAILPAPPNSRTSTGGWTHALTSSSGSGIEPNSVNGALALTIPSDSNARVEASTVSGGIDNDFGLHVNRHRFVGRDLRGELGSGGTHIRLSERNGRIDVHHAQDGHALSPVNWTSAMSDEGDLAMTTRTGLW